MSHLNIHISSLLTREHGQTMTEMALLMALIVLIAMAGVLIFSNGLQALWDHLAQALPNG